VTGGRVRGRHVDHPMLDKWQFFIGVEGATWPSHGLPRGTLWFARDLCKIMGSPSGSNPRPPPRYRLARPG
jgi:hypothetical protein